MTTEVVERLYRFTAVWRDGKLSGSSVELEKAIIEDGVTTEVIPQKVRPIGDVPNGYPLQAVLDQLHIDALTATDVATEAQKTAEQSATEAQAKVTEMLAAVDAALGQLTAQTTALTEVKAKFAPVVEEVSAEPAK